MALLNTLLLIICVASSGIKYSKADTFDVTQYGAKGDGETDDSKAFLKAWNATCGATEGYPTLYIPGGKTFFLNPVSFWGPCISSSVQIQIDGSLVAPNSIGAWKNCTENTWISIKNMNGLNINGTGNLDAKGSIWWGNGSDCGSDNDIMDVPVQADGVCQKPTTFGLSSCNTTQMTGLSFLNSGGNHISIEECNNLNISQLNITAPKCSPNTDGIDIIYSSKVTIQNSFIGTGDDCIAISTGCFNINISGITCDPGHGISVGSLGKNGGYAEVDGVYVQHCNFNGTLSAARIKTWPGGTGYAKNIFYDHITLNDVQTCIYIDQFYSHTPEQPRAVEISNVHFTNVQGTSTEKVAINLDCSRNIPCQDIVIQNVNITSSDGQEVSAACFNAHGTASSVIPPVPCLHGHGPSSSSLA